jgi:hypothetical protein
MTPKFVAILIVEYHIDDKYGDPALLDQARQAAQLTHPHRVLQPYLPVQLVS